MNILNTTVLAICIFVDAIELRAETSADHVPPEIKAIRDNLNRIVSGHWIGRGTFRYEVLDQKFLKGPPIAVLDCEEEVHSIFDRATDRISFRRYRKQIRGDDPGKVATFPLAGFVSTPKYSLLLSQNSQERVPSVGVYAPIEVGKRLPQIVVPIIDIRMVSVASYDVLGWSFDSLIQYLNESSITVNDEGSGIKRIDVEDSNHFQSRYWVDERSGNQVIRYEMNEDPESHQLHGFKVPILTASETSWSHVGGVWVPNSVVIRSARIGAIIHLNLTFDWRSLNQGVNDDDFHWESWDLGIERVVDFRQGTEKPIILRGFDSSNEVVSEQLQKIERPTNRRLIFLFNILLICLIAGLAWRSSLLRKIGKRVHTDDENAVDPPLN